MILLPVLIFLGCGEAEKNPKFLHVLAKSGKRMSKVPVNKYIVLRFSAEIDADTVNGRSVCLLDETGSEVPSGMRATGNIIEIIPDTRLLPDTSYTIVVTTALRDREGRSLESTFKYVFDTVGEDRDDDGENNGDGDAAGTDTMQMDVSAPVMAEQRFSYAENTAAGTVVGRVLASDNVGVTGFVFTATDSNTSADGYFIIGSGGDISLSAAGAASEMNDFENGANRGVYSVKAFDAAGNAGTAEVTLSVADVNEAVADTAAPVMAEQRFSYAENTAAGTVVGRVLASDNVGVTGFVFTATDSNTSADGYFIIGSGGDISLSAAGAASEMNDFENGANRGVYSVKAFDAAGNAGTAEVTLSVADVNESSSEDALIALVDADSVQHDGHSGNIFMDFSVALDMSSVGAADFTIDADPDSDTDPAVTIDRISATGGNKTLKIHVTDGSAIREGTSTVTIVGEITDADGVTYKGGPKATFVIRPDRCIFILCTYSRGL